VSVDGSPDDTPEPATAAAVRERLREEAHSVKRAQVEIAAQRLGCDRDLTNAERAVLERLGTRLTEAVLETPTSRLDACEPDTVQSIARLFDLE
jgi:glutamyl-tRNA reductase